MRQYPTIPRRLQRGPRGSVLVLIQTFLTNPEASPVLPRGNLLSQSYSKTNKLIGPRAVQTQEGQQAWACAGRCPLPTWDRQERCPPEGTPAAQPLTRPAGRHRTPAWWGPGSSPPEQGPGSLNERDQAAGRVGGGRTSPRTP